MVDKPKAKVRQASLVDAAEDKADSLDKVVAQAFDSDPLVRLHVAQELSKTDDPRAIFALIELSSDKDISVKEAAQRALGQFKEDKEESEAIVSLEKIFAESKEAKKPEELPEVRQRMMPTLERLFAHYEPKKRDSVKRKLLPSIEKLFSFGARAPAQAAQDPLHGLDKISQSQAPLSPSQDLEPEKGVPRQDAANFPFGQNKVVVQPAKQDAIEVEMEDHEFAVPQSQSPEAEFEGEAPSAEDQVHEGELAANKLYSLAYRIATTPGYGKAELKREQNRLLANFKKEVGLAFKMAEERAHEEGMSNFNGLKPGMKNLSFAEMQIISISDVGYGSGSKKKPFAKVKLSDGHKEQAVLIPSERAHGITPQDKLALKGVVVDFLVETSEVVLLVKSKSKVIVVK